MLRITDAVTLDDGEFEERFVRASGPGGQNVNKVATAVQLRFHVPSSSLPDEVKHRLIVIAGSRVTQDDVLVIDSREHRTQIQNRDAARERLAAMIRQALVRPRPRRATRPTKTAKQRRLTSKKVRSDTKASRRRITQSE